MSGGCFGGHLAAYGGLVGLGSGQRSPGVLGFASWQLATLGSLGTGPCHDLFEFGGRRSILFLDARQCLLEPCQPPR